MNSRSHLTRPYLLSKWGDSFRRACCMVIFMFALVFALMGNLPAHAGVKSKAPDSATIYKNRCSACHLKTGKGVKRIYPPLSGHIEKFYKTPEGIEYLTYVITRGLKLPIEVNGHKYRGIMPAVTNDYSDKTIAYFVSYLEHAFAPDRDNIKRTASDLVIDVEDVKAIRAKKRKPKYLKALRERALEGLE